MNTKEYLEQLRSGVKMNFSDFTNLIDQEYEFLNVAFTNSDLVNSKEENQGSAKVFCFALMHSLSESETLRCFGEHYQSVVDEPDNELSHINIRNFIKAGWKGVSINFSALQVK
jgi:hypothetical protein